MNGQAASQTEALPLPKPTRRPSLVRPVKALLDGFVDSVDALLRRMSRDRRWVVVERDSGAFDIFERKGRKMIAFAATDAMTDRQRATLSKRSTDVVEMRLQPEKLIEATVRLPAGALGYVDKIIEHRLERLTPWRLDQIEYGYSFPKVPAADGHYEARLSATSKAIVAGSLARLSEKGLSPSVLGSAGDPLDTPTRIDLFRGARNAGGMARRRRIGQAAMALLFVSVSAFSASAWFGSAAESDLAAVDRDLAATRSRISSGSGGGLPNAVAQILQSKTEDAALFVLMNRLAAEIPADTYLSALEVRASEVHLSGFSADASRLIDVLENRLGFASASFEAPVVRLADGRDQFSIVAARKVKVAPVSP